MPPLPDPLEPFNAVPDPALAGSGFLARIPRDFAREHGILSQGPGPRGERLAITAQTDPCAVWNIGVHLGSPVEALVVGREALHQAIDAAYEQAAARGTGPVPDAAEEVGVDPAEVERLLASADQDLLSTDGKAPLVKLLDRLLFTAVARGASDLHLQPTEAQVLVRLRIDGVLDQGRPMPVALLRPLASRIKVMGRMDVAEHLVPQDGRTSLHIGDRTIDVRISTIPTAYGERVVLRLLDSQQHLLTMPDLGMPGPVGDPFLAAARRSSGIILVTGPTGSGKTTTLYATLRTLESRERNIMTIEDPIEYQLSSLGIPISQSQVNTRKGVNFANGLRHILRQDPDVIMVGEIRDAETARIAIQASLTGHLVLSTLHTNDAASAVTRLVDLGVEPYLVSASLSVVLAQRLVRRTCSACGGLGVAGEGPCTTCLGSGYKGRTGIFEVLPVTEAVRTAITQGARLADIRAAAQTAGMRSLGDAGRALAAAGITTVAEIERVIHHA